MKSKKPAQGEKKQAKSDKKQSAKQPAEVAHLEKATAAEQIDLSAARADSSTLTPAVLLSLQSSHGNRFVQRLLTPATYKQLAVQRAVKPTPATKKSSVDLKDLTLEEFFTHAREQVDWFSDPAISDKDRQRLRTLLTWTVRTGIMAGCGGMKVKDLLAAGIVKGRVKINESLSKHFELYGQAVGRDIDTAELMPTDKPAEALKWGKDLKKLMGTPGLTGKLLKHIMPHEEFKWQVDHNLVGPFCNYVKRAKPLLEAEGGMEADSFARLMAEGANPVSYLGTPLRPYMRNFHRFHKESLDKLVKNFSRPNLPNNKRKPLTLILHSAHDHNGAFHREEALKDVIVNPNITALIIEGKETLGDVAAELPTLAAKYGKDGKIDQVLFSGHGNARVIELGEKEAVNLDDPKAKAESDKLFEALLKNMADDPKVAPHRRIVFNACLVNSNVVPVPLNADPKKAAKGVRDHLSKKSSLATYVIRKVKDMGFKNIEVKGAAGSFGRVTLLDAGDGLDIISSEDPEITSDKLTYVEKGMEPEGVLRATLESWAGVDAPDPAVRQKETFEAMERRIKLPTKRWEAAIIKAIFQIILKNYKKDGEMIRQFAGPAGALGEAENKDEGKVSLLTGRGLGPGGKFASHAKEMFAALPGTNEYKALDHLPVIINEVWLRHEGSRSTDFMGALKKFNCQTGSKYLDIPFLKPALGSLLSGAATREKLLLAARVIDEDDAEPSARKFLLDTIGPGNTSFPKVLKVGDVFLGNPSETTVLEKLGLIKGAKAPVAPPPSKDKKANLDLDGDGTNETYIDPLPGAQGEAAAKAPVFEKPDSASTRLAKELWKKQKLYIVGESGNFFGFHNPWKARKVVFAEKKHIKRTT